MIFKEMKDTDLVRVLELEQACFKQPWLEKDCLYELNENPFSHGWILLDEDTIVGYAFLWETFEMAAACSHWSRSKFKKKRIW